MEPFRSGTAKRIAVLLLTAFLSLLPFRSADAAERYRLRFSFSAQAQGTILIFFKFRFYYEAAAELELNAEADGAGGLNFSLAKITVPAYVLRTLGFTGRAMVVTTAFTDYQTSERFSRERYNAWVTEHDNYARHIRRGPMRQYYLVENVKPQALSFRRGSDGRIGEAVCSLGLHYRLHPQPTDIYFQIFALMKEMLGFYNHSVWPEDGSGPPAVLPDTWLTPPIDLTGLLTDVGAQTERIVVSAVKFKQDSPFAMVYRQNGRNGSSLEISGENRSQPHVWRHILLKQYLRRLMVRRQDLAPERDEVQLVFQNGRDQGGKGYILLERIAP